MVEAMSKINKGESARESKQLLTDLMNQWLEMKKHSLGSTTLTTYTRHINLHINPYFEDVFISKLTDEDCSAFIEHLKTEKELASRSVKDIYKVLRSALDWAVTKGKIYKNVTKLIDMPAVEKKEIDVWDIEEVRKFDLVARGHREYAAFLLGYAAGLREGEILGLRTKDVDFERGTLSVVQTLSHEGQVLSAGAKTSSSVRLVSLDQKTLQVLKKKKAQVAAAKLHAGQAYQDNDLLFPTDLGTPISPRNFLRTFYKLMEKAEVKRITIHDLRHTHATLLLKQGVHPKIVQERLGHKSIAITLDLYSHVLPNMRLETATKFGSFLYDNNPIQEMSPNGTGNISM